MMALSNFLTLSSRSIIYYELTIYLFLSISIREMHANALYVAVTYKLRLYVNLLRIDTDLVGSGRKLRLCRREYAI